MASKQGPPAVTFSEREPSSLPLESLMASTSRGATEERTIGPPQAASRSRLASPATALVLGLLTLLLEAVDVPLESQIHTLSVGNYGFELAFVVPFTLVGVVVARREPRNPMGWLLLAVALVEVTTSVASDYAVFVYHFGHRGWPLGPVAVLLDISFAAGLLLMPLVLLLFPDGRPGARVEVGAPRRARRVRRLFRRPAQRRRRGPGAARTGVERGRRHRRQPPEWLRRLGERRQADHPAPVRAALHRIRGCASW